MNDALHAGIVRKYAVRGKGLFKYNRQGYIDFLKMNQKLPLSLLPVFRLNSLIFLIIMFLLE